MFTAAKIRATHGKGSDFYRKHLSCNDYYSERDEVIGRWKGNLADAFNLEWEKVSQEDFSSFQQNINPVTKGKLTPRNNPKSIRFYDAQCSAQKSVSIMATLDSRLKEAHKRAVELGMRELEKFAAVRIRKGDNCTTKNFAYTGKIVYAQYHHTNSRTLDPQLHTHNVICNVTQDTDGTYKALDASEIYRSIRYFGKVYQNAMARECIYLGYDIEMKHSDKGQITGFEIKGVPEELLKRCSQRRAQIEKGIDEFIAKNGREPTATEVKTITLQTRSRKMLEKTPEQVKRHQESLFTDKEKELLSQMASKAKRGMDYVKPVEIEKAKEQIEQVVAQMFERHSVLRLDAILAEVQNQNLGRTKIDELHKAVELVPGLINLEKPAVNPYFTTKDNLERENFSIEMVNRTKGTCKSFASDYKPFSDTDKNLDFSAQKEAVETIIESKDPFMVFRGVAGAGKTSALQELCKCLRKGGVKNIQLVAPTNSAVDVLRSENFGQAQTVASFLMHQDKQPPKKSYLIIDESGLNSLKHGSEIIKLAMQNDYRVLFVGDERQHSSVEAGDFFRLLERHSDITKTSLSKIHRQQTKEYREGVEIIAAGSCKEGFEHLDGHGFIEESKIDYLENAAQSFMQYTQNGQNPLDCIAVCPTIKEGDKLTGMIREKMKAEGMILNDENNTVESFKSWGWTKPQLGSIKNYKVGMKVFFSTKVRGVALPGEMAEVQRIEGKELVLSNGATIKPSDIRNCIDVGSSSDLPVGKGDIVRFTVNKLMPGYKINNGSLAVSTGNSNEYILLDSSRRELMKINLPESFKGIKYGWVMTSHASQGMTAKNVVTAAEKMSKQAFYVSCSRGKYNLRLHVPEKEYFKDKLMNLKSERLSVHDLVANGEIKPSFIPKQPDIKPRSGPFTAEKIKAECCPEPGKLMRDYYINKMAKVINKIKVKALKVVSDFINMCTHDRFAKLEFGFAGVVASAMRDEYINIEARDAEKQAAAYKRKLETERQKAGGPKQQSGGSNVLDLEFDTSKYPEAEFREYLDNRKAEFERHLLGNENTRSMGERLISGLHDPENMETEYQKFLASNKDLSSENKHQPQIENQADFKLARKREAEARELQRQAEIEQQKIKEENARQQMFTGKYSDSGFQEYINQQKADIEKNFFISDNTRNAGKRLISKLYEPERLESEFRKFSEQKHGENKADERPRPLNTDGILEKTPEVAKTSGYDNPEFQDYLEQRKERFRNRYYNTSDHDFGVKIVKRLSEPDQMKVEYERFLQEKERQERPQSPERNNDRNPGGFDR